MIRSLFKSLFGKKDNNNQSNDLPVSDKEETCNDGNFEEKEDMFDTMNKQEFLQHESAYRHQQILFRRATESNRIILGELLERLLQVDKSSIRSMAVTYRMEMTNTIKEYIIGNPEDIWNFDLFSCILKRKDEEGVHYTMGIYHETILIIKLIDKVCIFVLTSLGGSNVEKYMRVSMLIPDNSAEDDGRTMRTQNAPIATSFILAYSEVDNNPEYELYCKVEKSTEETLRQGKSLSNLEDYYLHGRFEFHGYYYLGYGKWLFDQKRYYDACSMLERAFNYMKSNLDYLNKERLETFYGSCNMLGICLSKLDREDEASYFFRLGAPGLNLQQANFPALCHAKLGNPVAMSEMDSWIKLVAMQYGGHENWTEEVKQFGADVPIALMNYKKEFEKSLLSSPNYHDAITIGYVLKALWGLNQKNLVPCMFIYDIKENKFQERLHEVEDIMNYPLNTKDAINKVLVLTCTHAHYMMGEKEEDQSILCLNAPIVIATHAITCKEGTVCTRVDMMRQNFSTNDDKREFVTVNAPLNITFNIGLPYNFDFKHDKDSLLEGVRKANDLLEERRFVETLQLAKWIFECTQNSLKDDKGLTFKSKDEMLWAIYFEAAYLVGFSLMELGNILTAAYYLEISSHDHNGYRNIGEYINCLSNSQDPQAIDAIDSVMEHSPKPSDESNLKDWNYHMAFLRRRKAYVLIDSKRYSEAKQLLTEMKDDPLSAQFAEGELNYIAQMEKSQ